MKLPIEHKRLHFLTTAAVVPLCTVTGKGQNKRMTSCKHSKEKWLQNLPHVGTFLIKTDKIKCQHLGASSNNGDVLYYFNL